MTAEWFVKVTGMLVQNWATISVGDGPTKIYFVNDHGVCFDRLDYDCASEARNKLARNGFHPVDFENKTDYSAAICPKKVLHEGRGSNQPIYSSGEYGKW